MAKSPPDCYIEGMCSKYRANHKGCYIEGMCF